MYWQRVPTSTTNIQLEIAQFSTSGKQRPSDLGFETISKYATEAREARRRPQYWSRYEFAAVHGGRYCYIRTWQGLRPKDLEDIVLARFAKKYRSFPIANGAGAWKKVQREIPHV